MLTNFVAALGVLNCTDCTLYCCVLLLCCTVAFCSDFPFVVPECGYREAWSILPQGFASEEQIEGLMSSTACSLFRRSR